MDNLITCLKMSATHRCFYGKYSTELLFKLQDGLKGSDPLIEDRFKGQNPFVGEKMAETISVPASYRDELIKRRYSKSTRENYEAQFKAFLEFVFPKTADACSDKDIHD